MSLMHHHLFLLACFFYEDVSLQASSFLLGDRRSTIFFFSARRSSIYDLKAEKKKLEGKRPHKKTKQILRDVIEVLKQKEEEVDE